MWLSSLGPCVLLILNHIWKQATNILHRCDWTCHAGWDRSPRWGLGFSAYLPSISWFGSRSTDNNSKKHSLGSELRNSARISFQSCIFPQFFLPTDRKGCSYIIYSKSWLFPFYLCPLATCLSSWTLVILQGNTPSKSLERKQRPSPSIFFPKVFPQLSIPWVLGSTSQMTTC